MEFEPTIAYIIPKSPLNILPTLIIVSIIMVFLSIGSVTLNIHCVFEAPSTAAASYIDASIPVIVAR